MAVQELLFGGLAPSLDPRLPGIIRYDLGLRSWIDHHPAWLRGHDTLFDHLEATTTWRADERPMYDRIVTVPRLTASLPDDGPGHPVLLAAAAALSARYSRRIDQVSLALYRGGDDSVAFHNDRVGEDRLDDSIVAIVSLRGPRRLRLRPKEGRAKVGGASRAFDLGFGDLLVMGGACQRHFDHGVAKVAGAPSRMSLMLREGGRRS